MLWTSVFPHWWFCWWQINYFWCNSKRIYFFHLFFFPNFENNHWSGVIGYGVLLCLAGVDTRNCSIMYIVCQGEASNINKINKYLAVQTITSLVFLISNLNGIPSVKSSSKSDRVNSGGIVTVVCEGGGAYSVQFNPVLLVSQNFKANQISNVPRFQFQISSVQ